jgi:Putative restriction endonuclease
VTLPRSVSSLGPAHEVGVVPRREAGHATVAPQGMRTSRPRCRQPPACQTRCRRPQSSAWVKKITPGSAQLSACRSRPPPKIRDWCTIADWKRSQPLNGLAVIEVLSPSSGGHDQITKRRFYGYVGIRHYWIVDPPNRTLTVLRHDGAAGYEEVAVVKPGTTWRTDDPFPLALDPADFT